MTGGAGFIGSHLCRRLVADGHEVVAFDDLSEGTVDNLADVPEVRFVRGDVRDERGLASVARGCSVIFHEAAIRSVPKSIAEPQATTDVNVRGTLNALLAARDAGAALVFASSSSVYGDQHTFPLHEDMRPMPRSPYAASKLAGEAYCRAWALSYGVPAVALRYFNVYGPGQDPASEYAAVVPRFVIACLTGARPEIHGDGEQSRDFTYIDDVVEANILAGRASDEARGTVLNIGGGRRPTSINEILRIVAGYTGASPVPSHTPPREGDVARSEADVSRAERLIGYRPSVEVAEGLHRTASWFAASVQDQAGNTRHDGRTTAPSPYSRP